MMCLAKNSWNSVRLMVFVLVYLFFYDYVTAFAGQTGYVTKIIDGDSLVLRNPRGKRVEVRLYGIDSPEWDQPDAELSKKYLKEQVLRKNVDFEVYDVDRYGRKVAIVRTNGGSLNESLVEQGFAWVYPRYCTKKICEKWRHQEIKASRAKKGLWKKKKPVSPWQWRHK